METPSPPERVEAAHPLPPLTADLQTYKHLLQSQAAHDQEQELRREEEEEIHGNQCSLISGGGPREEVAQARGGGAEEHRLSTSFVPDDLASWS